MYYGHISLDVWNTLISPNPKFAHVRDVCLANKFGVHTNVIKRVHTRTKQACDQELAITYGVALSSFNVWKLFIRYLAEDQQRPEFNIRDCIAGDTINPSIELDLYNKVHELFQKYPPVVLAETIDAVQSLYCAGARLHIASNTNFISGHMMKPFLKKHFGSATFHSHTYSDEVNVAKPSTAFFYRVWSNMTDSSRHHNTPVHIGDDARYDIGASSVGIRPEIITDPLDTARFLNSLEK